METVGNLLVILIVLALLLVPFGSAVVCALKGQWLLFGLGFLLGVLWIGGAFRLARPGSWWDEKFYGPEKHARAVARHGEKRDAGAESQPPGSDDSV